MIEKTPEGEQYLKVQEILWDIVKEKSKKYGLSWKDGPLSANGQGCKQMLAEISGKFMRMRTMAWEDDPNKWRPELIEAFADMANYAIFAIMLLQDDLTEEDKEKLELIWSHN